jgi:hypothetical protein
MLLLFFNGVSVTANDTYILCSSVDPDVMDFYVDGVLVRRMTSA